MESHITAHITYPRQSNYGCETMNDGPAYSVSLTTNTEGRNKTEPKEVLQVNDLASAVVCDVTELDEDLTIAL
ncbi:hypothetical protein Hamer_G020482, partial [Homarus americanus]